MTPSYDTQKLGHCDLVSGFLDQSSLFTCIPMGKALDPYPKGLHLGSNKSACKLQISRPFDTYHQFYLEPVLQVIVDFDLCFTMVLYTFCIKMTLCQNASSFFEESNGDVIFDLDPLGPGHSYIIWPVRP